MSRKLLALILCVATIPGSVYAMTAVEIARRALDADRHVSYRGVKSTIVRVNQVQTTSAIKVVHRMPDMTRKEYFAPSPLAGTIVIQSGREAWKCDGCGPLWENVISAKCAPGRPNCDSAFANYVVELAGSEKIAGRDAYVIRAVPKGNKEPHRTLWVDKKCFLILRTQVETPEGSLLGSSGFTSITINPGNISPSAFVVAGKVESLRVPAGLDFRVRRPSYLPKGYRLIGLTRESANGHPCAHLQFSNGVNTISLFERKCAEAADAPRVPKKLTTVVAWVRDGVLFTLIGEVARAELKKVADSTK